MTILNLAKMTYYPRFMPFHRKRLYPSANGSYHKDMTDTQPGHGPKEPKMTGQVFKKPALVFGVVIVTAVIFWPLPPQFKYIGSQFLTFAAALYIGLRIWRCSPRGKAITVLQSDSPYGWLPYPLVLLLAAGLTYFTMTYMGYWPRALLEFILVIGIVYYMLRAFKRFLI